MASARERPWGRCPSAGNGHNRRTAANGACFIGVPADGWSDRTPYAPMPLGVSSGRRAPARGWVVGEGSGTKRVRSSRWSAFDPQAARGDFDLEQPPIRVEPHVDELV